jgi:very-short-patch-repair endonuclease
MSSQSSTLNTPWMRKDENDLYFNGIKINLDDYRVIKQTDALKFPYRRKFVFIDQYLNLYEDYKKIVIPYEKLLYKVDNIFKLNLVPFGLGLDMTPLELFRKAILGLYLPHKMDIRFTDNNSDNLTPKNIIVNDKPVSKIIEYRYNGLLKRTPQEDRLFNILDSKSCRSKLSTLCPNNWKKKKNLEVIEQGLFRSEKSFYLVDFVIKGFNAGSLGIELDGYYHFTDDGKLYDLYRDAEILSTYNIKLLRISNNKFDAMSDLDIINLLHNTVQNLSTANKIIPIR